MSSKIIVGIDEVGRGSLAGPLIVGAVILNSVPKGLRDSKKLSFSMRLKLNKEIREVASAIGIGLVSNKFIDKFGLTQAISVAMNQALRNLKVDFYHQVIIDGNFNFLPDNKKVITLIKADDKIAEVMAASIVAKVYRDSLMIKYAKIYPLYGFNQNFGYGTSAHLAAINQYGISKIHRLSFKPMKDYLN